MRKLFETAMKMLASAAFAVSLSAAAGADTADGEQLIGKPWEEVVSAANGGTVNFYMRGGSDAANRYVSEWVAREMKQRFDITINRVGIGETSEAVDIVLGEKEAGTDATGTVDMIWIGGENFRSMKRDDLLFCGYLKTLPNNKYVDWKDASIAFDFGEPVEDCEVPWGKAQFAFAYDSAFLREVPKTIPKLLEWIKANPGQFTYPAPPEVNGSLFVRHVLYSLLADPSDLLVPFDQVTYDDLAPQTWAMLKDIEPYLWSNGQTYPDSIAELNRLFTSKEVSIAFSYDPASFGRMVEEGTLPETIRTYGLEDGSIGKTDYIAIPYNSPNKAAAMVLANFLLSGEAALEMAKPSVWGASPAITIRRLPKDLRTAFAEIERHPSVVSTEELAENALPELRADWLAAIEKGWRENVGN